MARLGLDVVPVVSLHGSPVPWKTVQGVPLLGPAGAEDVDHESETGPIGRGRAGCSCRLRSGGCRQASRPQGAY